MSGVGEKQRRALPPGSGPRPGGGTLRDFLRRTRDYDRAQALIPRRDLIIGAWSALILLVAGLLLAVVPGPSAVRQGEFRFLGLEQHIALGRGVLAVILAVATALAPLFAATGIAGVALNAHLVLHPRQALGWHYVNLALAAAALLAVAVIGATLAIVTANIAIGLALVAITAALIAGVLVIAALFADE